MHISARRFHHGRLGEQNDLKQKAGMTGNWQMWNWQDACELELRQFEVVNSC
jgi:lipopolysaccharide/colanic/teichoic acid biosynthesis glycosyltransferase